MDLDIYIKKITKTSFNTDEVGYCFNTAEVALLLIELWKLLKTEKDVND